MYTNHVVKDRFFNDESSRLLEIWQENTLGQYGTSRTDEMRLVGGKYYTVGNGLFVSGG